MSTYANNNQANQDLVTSFWHTNFQCTNTTDTVSRGKSFKLFQKLHVSNNTSYDIFLTMTGRAGIQHKCKQKIRFLIAKPTSTVAIQHFSSAEDNSTSIVDIEQPTSPFLLNAQGIITQSGAKCQLLHSKCTPNNIIAITESWLKEDNLDAELLKHFPNFSILRADRNLQFPGPNTISSRGGCILLTSPTIPITYKMAYSNGN